LIRRTVSLLLLVFAALPAFSQSHSTDYRALELYAFGGLNETATGLPNSTNMGITAGVDLGYGVHYGILPQLEVRGTFPMSDGTVAAEKNFLGGLKIEKIYGRYHPYANFLVGRGQIDYQGAGYLDPSGTVLYQRTNSNVWSPGGGIDFDVTQSFAVKADFQYQHYDTPVTTSGSLYAKAFTIGVVYRFGYRQNHPY
jgi:opacity protein-like surface antigen